MYVFYVKLTSRFLDKTTISKVMKKVKVVGLKCKCYHIVSFIYVYIYMYLMYT